jgi:hypothetical protein
MSTSYLSGAVGWALMAALVLGSGTMARAQNAEGADNNTEGVVKIGRSDKDTAKPNVPAPTNHGQAQAPKYWVGLLVGDIPAEHVLRAQIDLPENTGLLVANVLGNSPAAKAGLKQHDILLKANGHDLHENTDLIDLVNTEGAKKGQITIEYLRHNKRQTAVLKPEERPANAPGPADDEVGGGANGAFGPAAPGLAAPGVPDDLMRQFREQMQQMPFEFRSMGPGVIVGGGGVGNLPNGVSVTMQKENDKPVHVTISRDGKSWTVSGDDPESLKKVPEDLRPFAEQMLHGGNGAMHFNMRGMGRDGGPAGQAGPNVDAGRIRDRLDQMEKRLEEMQKHFHDQQNSTDKNDDHNQSN